MREKTRYSWGIAKIRLHKVDGNWHWHATFYGWLRRKDKEHAIANSMIVRNNGSYRNKKHTLREIKEFVRLLNIPCEIEID